MLNREETEYYTDLIARSKAVLDNLNIKYADDIRWDISTSKSIWGNCSRRFDRYTIQINERLLKTRKDKVIMDTIIHELLHSVDGCMEHTGKWKRLAEVVNARTKFDIQRVTTASSKGIEPDYKYKVVCTKCNTPSYYYSSRAKIIKYGGVNSSRFRCNICGSNSFSCSDNKGRIIF